jgi:hypothetical protein
MTSTGLATTAMAQPRPAVADPLGTRTYRLFDSRPLAGSSTAACTDRAGPAAGHQPLTTIRHVSESGHAVVLYARSDNPTLELSEEAPRLAEAYPKAGVAHMKAPAVRLTEQPPALTEAYHKARRSYVLFSALLIAWELIGFEVSEVPLENVKIAVKSPQAIPAVLIALIVYFALRILQEWSQCDVRRRKDKWALSDFAGANTIAAVAILIYSIQRVLEVQLADLIGIYDVATVMIWFGLGFFVLLLVMKWTVIPPSKKLLIGLMAFWLATSIFGITKSNLSYLVLAMAVAITFLTGLITYYIYDLLKIKRYGKRRAATSGSDR